MGIIVNLILLSRQCRLHEVFSVWSLTHSGDLRRLISCPFYLCCAGWQLPLWMCCRHIGILLQPLPFPSFKNRNFGIIDVEGTSMFPSSFVPSSFPFSSQCCLWTCRPTIPAPGILRSRSWPLCSAPLRASHELHLCQSNISITCSFEKEWIDVCFPLDEMGWLWKVTFRHFIKINWVCRKQLKQEIKINEGWLSHLCALYLSCDNERSLVCLWLRPGS